MKKLLIFVYTNFLNYYYALLGLLGDSLGVSMCNDTIGYRINFPSLLQYANLTYFLGTDWLVC